MEAVLNHLRIYQPDAAGQKLTRADFEVKKQHGARIEDANIAPDHVYGNLSGPRAHFQDAVYPEPRNYMANTPWSGILHHDPTHPFYRNVRAAVRQSTHQGEFEMTRFFTALEFWFLQLSAQVFAHMQYILVGLVALVTVVIFGHLNAQYNQQVNELTQQSVALKAQLATAEFNAREQSLAIALLTDKLESRDKALASVHEQLEKSQAFMAQMEDQLQSIQSQNLQLSRMVADASYQLKSVEHLTAKSGKERYRLGTTLQ